MNRTKAVGVLVAGFVLLGIPSYAQVQHKMQKTVEPPMATTKPSGQWLPKSIAYVKASNNKADLQFGTSIALSGDGQTLAVGSTGEESGAKGINGNQADHSAINSGAVYVYVQNGGKWVQQAYIKASNPRSGAMFGNAIALSNNGSTLVVGSTGESSAATGVNGNQDDTSMDSSGAAYVFTRTGTAWTQQAYVKASNTGGPDVGYVFGYSVAVSGDGNTIAIGSTSESSNATGINGDQKNTSLPESGAVYVFGRTGTAWTQQAYVKPWNTTTRNVLFGYSVGLSDDGSTMAAGAYDEQNGRGAIYVFTRNNGNWMQQTRLQGANAEAQDSLGCSLAISGDGNTVVAGAFDEDAILTGIQPTDAGAKDEDLDSSAGAAYVFVRNNGKWTQQAYMKAFNTRQNDQFGWALAISRDGNTIAVGSHLEDSDAKGLNGNQSGIGAEDSGAVYVYTRSGSTWTPASYVKAPNTHAGDEFGISAALSGDGKILAVGAFKEAGGSKGVNGNQADQSAINAGAAYVYY